MPSPTSSTTGISKNNASSTMDDDHHHQFGTTIATTPSPPYYAVIFTSTRGANNNNNDNDDYKKTASRMIELAIQQPGFLGLESVREKETEAQLGITVSYWKDLNSIQQWKHHSEHVEAQSNGQKYWYTNYTTRICLVERDYTLDDHTT